MREAAIQEPFTDLYVALRQKEGRIYSDEEVRLLPQVFADHPCYKEWNIRSRGAGNLLRHIAKNGHICNILDIGCGNGWLSAKLAKVARGKVTGVDINTTELNQARKVFGEIPNLRFVNGDIRSGILSDQRYDLLVFAASVQYFPSLDEILKVAVCHLTLQGEIHLLDSHLYRRSELAAARLRSKAYFTQLGFQEMEKHYFHHCLDDLHPFSHTILHNPHSPVSKFSLHRNPFHWVLIKNSNSPKNAQEVFNINI